MALTTTSPRRDENRRVMALAALFAGATAIATSALFVKVSEAGPVSTAFWRVFLALPFLWAWALFENRPQHFENFTRDRRFMVLAGVFFAGDPRGLLPAGARAPGIYHRSRARQNGRAPREQRRTRVPVPFHSGRECGRRSRQVHRRPDHVLRNELRQPAAKRNQGGFQW